MFRACKLLVRDTSSSVSDKAHSKTFASSRLWVLLKEGTLRILLTCIGLALVSDLLIISYAERQQQAAIDVLSNYKLEPQIVLDTAEDD